MRKIKQIFESVRQKVFLGSSLTLKSTRFLYLIPIIGFIITTLIFGVIIYTSSEKSTFAAPGIPAPIPTLTQTISTTSINFSFNSNDLRTSATKILSTNVKPRTNNVTGLTTTISSIDEDTSLNSTDPANTDRITSTDGMYLQAKTWGYRYRQSPGTTNYTMSPIPKASTPDTILSTTNNSPVDLRIDFGVKVAPGLTSGTYTKQLIITSFTNHVPTTATFLPGQQFMVKLRSVNPNYDTDVFRRSQTAPPNIAAAVVISTNDSAYPIYVWYDAAQKTILWWSEADISYANEDASQMFMGINFQNSHNVQLLDLRGINTSRTKNMRFMFTEQYQHVKHIDLSEFDTSRAENMRHMFSDLTESHGAIHIVPDLIDFSKFNTKNVKDMSYMFFHSRLPSIDIRNFDTSNVTDMDSMFSALKNVTSLDLSNLNTRRVVNMSNMFWSSKSLVSLNISNWKNDSCTNMSFMFSDLESLTDLNIDGFTTQNVTNMISMFNGAKRLENLDLSSFDTHLVTNMSRMFQDMESLKTINLSRFNTSSVTTMSHMFFMTNANPPIVNLDLSSFNTSAVTDMERMFVGLANLQNLNLSSFDTRNVTNMEAMFYYTFVTHPNGVLDISNFNTNRVNHMNGMFNYMKVRTIYASPNFVTNSLIPQPSNIFMDNNNLTGGNGTTYAWPNYTSNFAHIDAPGNPGYFTRKP